jgi:hypothetical protein
MVCAECAAKRASFGVDPSDGACPHHPAEPAKEDPFRSLVRQMRHAQCEYFRTRDHSWLRTSKDLESKVDKALAPPPPDAPRLFP